MTRRRTARPRTSRPRATGRSTPGLVTTRPPTATGVITAARTTAHWPQIEKLRAGPLNVHGITQLRQELLDSGARELALARADELLARALRGLDEVGVPNQLCVELERLMESITGRAR